MICDLCAETYRLAPSGAGTLLEVAADMGEEHDDDMVAAWDRALDTIALLGVLGSQGLTTTPTQPPSPL